MLISRTIDNIGNEMAAQVLNDSCHRQRDKGAKKMMHKNVMEVSAFVAKKLLHV